MAVHCLEPNHVERAVGKRKHKENTDYLVERQNYDTESHLTWITFLEIFTYVDIFNKFMVKKLKNHI